jgi:hypothetical protein
MPWDDAADLVIRLNQSLNSFDWPQVAALTSEISERIKTTPEPLPEKIAKPLLYNLRRKQCFREMTIISESLVQTGAQTSTVQRQYAQALIDQGLLTPSELMLRSILQDSHLAPNEESEARGLIGRIYKQLYVNRNDPKSAANQKNLEQALKEYLYVYRLDPKKSLWHGINAVALAARAQRDGISITGLPDPKLLAQEIRATLDEKEANADVPEYWDLATRVEACVALGETKECVDAALNFVDSPGADAFEVNSTLRQLTEVWQLNDDEPPGNQLLPILKAGLLKRKPGAVINTELQQVKAEAKKVDAAINDLEGVYGDDRMVPLKWYRKGLEQCNSIARIEKLNGKGYGTGWLVNASDFFPNRTGLLLLTNAHVITDTFDPFGSNPMAITPDDANANFQAVGENQVYPLGDVVWTSPPDADKFDATFVTIKGDPPAKPLTIHQKPVMMAQPTPRLYIIGHPGGRDLEISLQDNYLLGCNDRLLHYRTPTEHGSSGSPVFEAEDWRVVALHHKGSEAMNRLDGQPGTYAANEGIAILAIQNAVK